MSDDASSLNKVKNLLNNFYPNGQINRNIIGSMTTVNLEQLIKLIKKMLFGLERIKNRSVDPTQRDYASDLLDNLNKLNNYLELIYRRRIALQPQAPQAVSPLAAPPLAAQEEANDSDNESVNSQDTVVYGGINYKKTRRHNKTSRRHNKSSKRNKRSRIHKKKSKRNKRSRRYKKRSRRT